jgi:hypothetical protein
MESEQPVTAPRFELKPELFPRSVQSLRRDGYAPIGFGLVPALVVLVAWVVWMSSANVPLFATSHLATVDARQVVATFRADERANRIRIGQTARVRLEGLSASRYGVATAVVAAIDDERSRGDVRVVLSLSESSPEISLREGLAAEVEVEVARVSPLALLIQSSGRRTADPSPR